MSTKTVDLVLSNPWVDAAGKVHDVGERVSVEPELAERLITAGNAVGTDAIPASAKK